MEISPRTHGDSAPTASLGARPATTFQLGTEP